VTDWDGFPAAPSLQTLLSARQGGSRSGWKPSKKEIGGGGKVFRIFDLRFAFCDWRVNLPDGEFGGTPGQP